MRFSIILLRFVTITIIVLTFSGCLQTPPGDLIQTQTNQATLTEKDAIPTASSTFNLPTVKIPAPTSTREPTYACEELESLPNDSAEVQKILDELIANFKQQYPTEYMGMAILKRVDRLGEWAVIQGSVSGEGKDVLAVKQTPQGYQLAERYIITAPLESFDEPQTLVPQYFLKKLPEAPEALFTYLDQSWLLGQAPETETQPVYRLAYIGTSDNTTTGVTEINAVLSDGSNHTILLSEPMLIMGLVPSPDGEQITFWGCPGSLANDCLPGEDLDVWVVNWDGSNLRNLTEDSASFDGHPHWSPDGQYIVFDSDRTGISQLFLLSSDGSEVRQLTDGTTYNSEPTWSPDGKWIAYHCTQEGDIQICVISPEGQPAGEPISGTAPVWSPASSEDGARLAFLCFQESHSELCTVQADGSEPVNLTNSPSDEHSTVWSPDGTWLAFVSNRGNDVDVYKVCATCPEEPVAVRLTDEVRSAGWPAWSPDGSRVAYVEGGNLMLVNADRSGVTYLASGVFSPPIWQPYSALETWQTYSSQDGSYTIRYPPEAEIHTSGVIGFPAEELPAGLSPAEYIEQLENQYPSDLCVSIDYGLAFISIRTQAGEKYGPPCGVTGVGDYEVINKLEEIVLGDTTIEALKHEIYDNQPEGQEKRLLTEFYMLQLPDGTHIDFGGHWVDREGTFQDYLADKAVLLKILATYHYERIETINPSNAIEAIDAIRSLLDLPMLPLEFIETTTMLNSPNMDLTVALYQDSEGRNYFVDPQTNRVVEIDARAVLSSISPEAVSLSEELLKARAEEIARSVVQGFDTLRTGLVYDAGAKGDHFFFTWRSADAPGAMNKPFMQIGLHKSGVLFAYYNTLTLK